MRTRWLRCCMCCSPCEPEVGRGSDHTRDVGDSNVTESPYEPNQLLKKMSYIDSGSSCSSVASFKESYSQDKCSSNLPAAIVTCPVSSNGVPNGTLNRRQRLSVVVTEGGVTSPTSNAITPKSTGSSHHDGLVSSAKVQVASDSPNHRPRQAWCEVSDHQSSSPVIIAFDSSTSVHHSSHDSSAGSDGGCSASAYRPNSLLKIPFIDSISGGGGGARTAASVQADRKLCDSNGTTCGPADHKTSSDKVTKETLTTSSSSSSLGRKFRLIFTDDSPTNSQPSSISVRMRPDDQGKYGFNVKGGKDQQLPILVSRVVPNAPADNATPKLNEGDQVLSVNGKDVSGLAHDEVVALIKGSNELTLIILPNVYSRGATINNGELGLSNGSKMDRKEQNGGHTEGDDDDNDDEDDDDEPTFQYIPEDASPASRNRVKKSKLEQSMALLSEHLDTNAVIVQFEGLYRKKSGECMDISRLDNNMNKNRYRDIMPYDSTRVILKENLNGDYINASFVNMEIPSSGIINRYIATQGPLVNTCEDFWQMVWEQGSHLIVMVTPLVERGRLKCLKYWPDPGDLLEPCCRLKVTCDKEIETKAMVERELHLTNVKTGERREITHIQYTSWPDHAPPDDASDFLSLVNRVRAIRSTSVEPVIVHCSAGIGRTGVLIMMETAMCLIEANEPIYPIEILKSMRDQRAMLIQTSGQFQFVCSAIHKVYKEGSVKPLVVTTGSNATNRSCSRTTSR
ncbi:Tyrosine-protein phosphatase non-receptor type 4 [Halotydeus destructor]|nr:Tyrosine-protein phosphatase non-receptor type 4 [Halotydeus destructor]